ncbi:hypothetical protein SLEP1_g51407 [Rubroshorea leprosula]|uniref:Uncharacterized protein n=1 Tax=Rubroshorea leprosula TaxID=152421 RepID=A0AAV5M3B3_9ROSI|nr:hypothetical protein SLEP1_g51407 [Rubroshorea leprosula]
MHISPRTWGSKQLSPSSYANLTAVWDCSSHLTTVEDTPCLAAWMAKYCHVMLT